MKQFQFVPHQYVMAELCGTWLSAWFREERDGKFLVEFSDDGPERYVNEIRPLSVEFLQKTQAVPTVIEIAGVKYQLKAYPLPSVNG